MNNQKIIADIISKLEKDKDGFLADVEKRIYEYIRAKSTIECLTITTQKKLASSKMVWKPSLIPGEGYDYARRLIPFLRKKKYKGQIVDSGLTDGVIEIVIDSFNRFYQRNNEALANKLVEAILTNEKTADAFMDGVLSSKLSSVSKSHIKSAAYDTILASLKTNFDSIAPIVKENAAPVIAKTTAIAASSPIVKAIITKLTIYIAAHLHIILAKLIAIPAVKVVLVTMVKKFVIAAIVAGILKFLVAKTGLSIGAIVAVILIPIIAVFIVREWNHFPEKLAEGISVEVANELSGKFTATNREILTEVVKYVTGDYAKQIGISIMEEDPSFAKDIDKLLKVIGS